MDDDAKFKDKIESKQFLIGRFETSLREKLAKKAKRARKIESTKYGSHRIQVPKDARTTVAAVLINPTVLRVFPTTQQALEFLHQRLSRS